jgi:hypothetical protein
LLPDGRCLHGTASRGFDFFFHAILQWEGVNGFRVYKTFQR